MVRTCNYFLNPSNEPNHVDWPEPIGSRAVAKLTPNVLPPALDTTGRRDNACVFIARSDTHCA